VPGSEGPRPDRMGEEALVGDNGLHDMYSMG
jgi:hypothetical protein